MARIYLEAEFVSLHQKFEIETDDLISGIKFKEQLLKQMENINPGLSFSINQTNLYIPKLQVALNEHWTLKENNIVGGDIVLVL
ncbi:hypothetical protein [Holdemania massiliensis]|uniref:hypothetical protein n=1 Tax=Holdemania massiliensis TaxID=1468449 RepID=UPI0003102995|nr:hypothetical protein [Holdemania massiliensis]